MKNEYVLYQNLWNAVKTMLRRIFKALKAYIRKEEGLKSII